MIQLNSGEKYDIDVDTWQKIAPMNTRRMGKILDNGQMYHLMKKVSLENSPHNI